MKTVMRSNKQLRVADDRLAEMRRRGFVEVDPKTGAAIPTEAKTAAEALEAENAALREENTALKTRLETLQAQLAGSAAQGAKRQR